MRLFSCTSFVLVVLMFMTDADNSTTPLPACMKCGYHNYETTVPKDTIDGTKLTIVYLVYNGCLAMNVTSYNNNSRILLALGTKLNEINTEITDYSPHIKNAMYICQPNGLFAGKFPNGTLAYTTGLSWYTWDPKAVLRDKVVPQTELRSGCHVSNATR